MDLSVELVDDLRPVGPTRKSSAITISSDGEACSTSHRAAARPGNDGKFFCRPFHL